MGCALSTAEKDAVQRSLAIDKSLASEGAFRQNEIKLLLLGKLVFTVVIELYTSTDSACKASRVVLSLSTSHDVSGLQVTGTGPVYCHLLNTLGRL